MKQVFAEAIEVGWLNDGNRLSLRHGPIDLIIEADGNPQDVKQAYQQAITAFESVLTDLVAELQMLRKRHGTSTLYGDISTNMHRATATVAGGLFATPMIAVAGAVADHILHAMTSDTHLKRAYVNNGGDIALELNEDASFNIGICANIETGQLMSKARLHARDNVAGIATSGWRGRSHSLGIADAVTVLAQDAATADAAATLIANEIDLPGHTDIQRQAASELAPDSDLDDQLVTVHVGVLSNNDVALALSRGKKIASAMIEDKKIVAAYASLQGKSLTLGGQYLRKLNKPAHTPTIQTKLIREENSVA